MTGLHYDTDALDENEEVLGVFYGGRGQVGQKFVVTNRRLLMGPLSTAIAQKIESWLANKALAGSGDLLKDVLSNYAPLSPKTQWLRHVVAVQATNNASLFKPPGLQIKTDTQETLTLGIVASPKTMSICSKNNAIRDRAVQVINEAVQAAKAGPPAPA